MPPPLPSAADINLGLIRYVLREESAGETMDNFHFLVKDSKPNVVGDNVFHIQWSLISFQRKRFAWHRCGAQATPDLDLL